MPAASRATLTSEPVAMNIISIASPDSFLRIYPPRSASLPVCSIAGRFCLESTRQVGVCAEVSAEYQAAFVSTSSAGLNTCMFGRDLSMVSCSTGSWVGPSSPTPMLSWVNTEINGRPIREERRSIGFI